VFSDALRAAFPCIRFVRYDYARKFFDYRAWKAACDTARRDDGDRPRQMDFTRDPGNALPDYFQSLGDVSEQQFWVWVEPPRWRPRWRRRKRADILVIENFPRLHFEFRRGGFNLPDPRRGAERQEDPTPQHFDLPDHPLSLDRDEPITLSGDRMLGGWKKGDDTAKAFVHKVWRILGKMTTNRLVAVDRCTRQPIPPDGTAAPEAYVRAATDALRWARWRRHNYLEWSGHWFKPEGYFDR
jgi:hypothetical protein